MSKHTSTGAATLSGDRYDDIGTIGMDLQDRLQEYLALHGEDTGLPLAGALCHMVADICSNGGSASKVLLHVAETVANDEAETARRAHDNAVMRANRAARLAKA